MFLTASGADIRHARLAALDTINAYQARNHADLIAIAQIVAYGLAALGSLSLSMADDISLSMVLRLRGNANACTRSAEQNRRALRESQVQANPSPEPRFEAADAAYGAEVLARLAETQKPAADTQTQLQAAEPSPPPAPTAPASPPDLTEQQRQAIWAGAMADVAREYAASIPHLPPAEHAAASMRIAALSQCADALLSGDVPPRLRPGALDATIWPNAA